MRGSFGGGRVLGIPIRVTPSWFIALAVTTGLFAVRIYPGVLPDSPSSVHWTLGFSTALLFFVCILLHEFGHAAVARAYHIPVRSITLSLFGGVAQIAQEVRNPLSELLIAAAGPLVSLLLTGVFYLLARLTPGSHSIARVLFTALWVLNISVGIFNLVPGFPMDGGRVLRATLWLVTGSYRWATRIAGWGGRFVAAALVVLGFALIAGIPGVPLRGDALSGVWMLLIGVYLHNAARNAETVERALEALRLLRAGDLLHADVPVIEAGARLFDFLPALMAAADCDAAFVVDHADAGRVVGLIGRATALLVPLPLRARLTAREIMLPAAGIRPAGPDETGAAILQRLEVEQLPAVPVVAGDILLGLIGPVNLERALLNVK